MHDNDTFDEAELQALTDRAKALPRDIAPAPEVWATIRDRIERSRVRTLVPLSSTDLSQAGVRVPDEPSRARSPRTLYAFGAAAALFVAVATLVLVRDGADESTARPVAVGPNSGPLTTASTSIESVFAEYDQATTDLTNDLAQRRSRLQPEAVAVIDSCLTTIDRAITESRTALADAPDNTTIAELLQLTYQQKIDLLRRAADLPLGSL
ncbi:MAG: hypothetical protein ABJB74_22315 [Gemmatimonas sp.]